MSIFRETTITWDGKSYDFIPSLALLRKIERGRPGEGPVSLVLVGQSAHSNAPLVPLMCQVIADVMHFAGASDFSEEETYCEALAGGKDGSQAVITLWYEIYAALSPVPKDQKKAVAPEES